MFQPLVEEELVVIFHFMSNCGYLQVNPAIVLPSFFHLSTSLSLLGSVRYWMRAEA